MANILQVAYNHGLLITRARMLESRGYAAADLIVIGFSAPYPVRAAMIHWFKQQYPNIPVVALRFHSAESFPEADRGNVSDDPDVWLVAVRAPSKNQHKLHKLTTNHLQLIIDTL